MPNAWSFLRLFVPISVAHESDESEDQAASIFSLTGSTYGDSIVYLKKAEGSLDPHLIANNIPNLLNVFPLVDFN